MVPSYSADLLVSCIENHCCLSSKLKSLWFLALQNQPSSGQASWLPFVVLLIKLCTTDRLPGQSVHTLIANKCSWTSLFFTFSVSMSGISPCVEVSNVCTRIILVYFHWQRFPDLWVMHWKERTLLLVELAIEKKKWQVNSGNSPKALLLQWMGV